MRGSEPIRDERRGNSTLIVFNGPPAAGKTSLAQPVARTLGLPYLSKDMFKHLLFDTLGTADREWSRTLGSVSVEFMFETLMAHLEVGSSAVVDNAFIPRYDRPRFKRLIQQYRPRVVEVWCSAAEDLLFHRFHRRAISGQRHLGHQESDVDQAAFIRGLHDRAYAPLRLSRAVVEVGVDDSPERLVEAVAAEIADEPNFRQESKHFVVMSGLPGTGKTSIADGIGRALVAPTFSKDRLEAVLLRSGLVPQERLGRIGYDLLSLLATGQMVAGRTAILDSVASTTSIRSEWRKLAHAQGATWHVMECICSDPAIHRRRLQDRRRGIPGWPELDWDHVEGVRDRFAPWTEARLVLDAVDPLSDNLSRASSYVHLIP